MAWRSDAPKQWVVGRTVIFLAALRNSDPVSPGSATLESLMNQVVSDRTDLDSAVDCKENSTIAVARKSSNEQLLKSDQGGEYSMIGERLTPAGFRR